MQTSCLYANVCGRMNYSTRKVIDHHDLEHPTQQDITCYDKIMLS